MHLEVSLDHVTSQRAGAGGMFQIQSVVDSGTRDDLSKKVDVGLHFGDHAELSGYLKRKFGARTTFEIVGEA